MDVVGGMVYRFCTVEFGEATESREALEPMVQAVYYPLVVSMGSTGSGSYVYRIYGFPGVSHYSYV